MQSGHIILGEEAFQTVTIVPTETNPGEVSYVLIVQQPDGETEKEKDEPEDAEDQDLTIYDFEDNEDPNTTETPVGYLFTNLVEKLLVTKLQTSFIHSFFYFFYFFLGIRGRRR